MTDRDLYASDIPPTVAIILGLKDYLGENLPAILLGFLAGFAPFLCFIAYTVLA